MTTITETDAENLASKLAALDLTEAERTLLDAVFAVSAESEVSGFELDTSSPMVTRGYTEVEWTFKDPRPGKYTEVEWTYLKGIGGLRG
jgi:hypothetical protein